MQLPEPGDTIERKRLHETYGGRTQGGIGPSRASPNVFIFSDPVAGEPHGYFDGWRDDSCFHYTGEGQYGDQQMKSGNAAILRHEQDGRALRVFMGARARGEVTYEDEFELADDPPWYQSEAQETGNGPVRKVILFRLRPKSIAARPGRSRLDVALEGPAVSEVPIENLWTERAFVAPSKEQYEAERREQALVRDYEAHLLMKRHDVCRLKIVPKGEAKPIFCDLYDKTANVLAEAKGSVTRGEVRMALGQLADYRRFVSNDPRRAVLLPEEPRADLLVLLESGGVSVIWKTGAAYADNAGGALA